MTKSSYKMTIEEIVSDNPREVEKPIIKPPLNTNEVTTLQEGDDLDPQIASKQMEIDISSHEGIVDPSWKASDKKIPVSVEDLENTRVDPNRPELELKISSQLHEPHRSNLILFLKGNLDRFTWSHEDMIDIDLKYA